MLAFLRIQAPPRRLRLFVAGCCRGHWNLLTDERARQAIQVAERFADGQADTLELDQAYRWALAALGACPSGATQRAGFAAAALAAASDIAGPELPAVVGGLPDQTRARWLAYDMLFAYSFQPAIFIPAAWLRWNGGTVPALARAIYDGHQFDLMPVLADALSEGGCHDEVLLHHCRHFPAHARGCRVLDAVLKADRDAGTSVANRAGS
jgi:hypothetical protein